MLTSVGTEGRPVSMTKCAAARYSGSRSRVQLAQRAAAGRPPAAAAGACRGAGGGTAPRAWSAGRTTCVAPGAARRGWPRAAPRRRRWPARRRCRARRAASMTCCSMSRKAASPSRSKQLRIGSRSASRSRGRCRRSRSPRCRARWRPTVDLPQPGMPTSVMVTTSVRVGAEQAGLACGRGRRHDRAGVDAIGRRRNAGCLRRDRKRHRPAPAARPW